ncbi:TaqI-like C-terminal specificity domain-containing protein [Nannocystis exedens]|uniref:site-specific DNA-methyltransferase (adenine-specific) n=1 Tax=Nannocystis exedens TaxID=54 RepID=A0A1I2BSU0_9BACT|nr:Eco57I restriction-modification methylase domain-containing protein [Nannocystis exedens]PCC71274.1 Modification methylase PaeR7I [Nannocystis exedens]SFE59134.1 TaqI-like C-terminal specificity domain-containing protein [Nannocystis exedens]
MQSSLEPRAPRSRLAGTDASERGAVFTRPEVVEALLDLAGYTADRPLHAWSVLEPSFGAGDFLSAIVERLLAACAKAGLGPEDARKLGSAVRGVEVHAESFERTRERVRARLRRWGASGRDATRLSDAWLLRGDFLLAPLAGPFDVVVGNPPYVRQERIPEALLAEYRRRYFTIYDRADLYVPFFERGLRLLGDGGRLAFICANRWLKNRYGGPLRGLVARDYHLSHYIDMEGTDAFQSEVFAYPAITVIRRGAGEWTRIARRPRIEGELPAVVQAMTRAGPVGDPRVEEVAQAVRGEDPWLLDSADQLRVLRRLEREFVTLEEAGCRVGIGVATGADRVFIADFARLPVEPARKLRLVMAADLREGAIAWGGRGIVNPFEADGALAEVERYPKFAAYVGEHREALQRRYVARRNPEAWYRTIDRIDPALTRTPKLLIPDIKGEATVAYDEGLYYPHHNLYHVTASTWDLRALATILRSSLALLFVANYGVKMAGGFLRFQAQYLRRIRVPRWDDVPAAVRASLIAARPDDATAIDRATFAAYGLERAEIETIRLAAAAARVGRKS